MNVLRWLHKNSFIVHMIVMMLAFYGVPVLVSALFYPHFIQPLTTAMVSGLILLSMGIASFKIGVAVTDAITAALDRAVLRDLESRSEKAPDGSPTVDFDSPNTLIVDRNMMSLGSAVIALQASSEPEAPAPPAETVMVQKKKRGPRAKTPKKEG